MKITRKNILKTLIGSLIVSPILASQKENEILIDIKADFRLSWKNSETYTLLLYNQVTEEKMDWQYTPESYSFRTQFVHCITTTAYHICARIKVKNPYEGLKTEYWAKFTKLELEQEIIKFYKWVAKIFEDSTNDDLTKNEQFTSGELPMWKIIYALENHIIHHRGQVICYLRLNGITPKGYVGWI
jgi:uncharacterized damage-inducible protein DinB